MMHFIMFCNTRWFRLLAFDEKIHDTSLCFAIISENAKAKMADRNILWNIFMSFAFFGARKNCLWAPGTRSFHFGGFGPGLFMIHVVSIGRVTYFRLGWIQENLFLNIFMIGE